MAADERLRIEIAFEGGQTVGGVVSADGLQKLRDALAGGPDGVVELEAEDSTYLIPVRAVVYVKRSARDTRIGFGRAG
jgi:hypothetical protein